MTFKKFFSFLCLFVLVFWHGALFSSDTELTIPATFLASPNSKKMIKSQWKENRDRKVLGIDLDTDEHFWILYLISVDGRIEDFPKFNIEDVPHNDVDAFLDEIGPSLSALIENGNGKRIYVAYGRDLFESLKRRHKQVSEIVQNREPIALASRLTEVLLNERDENKTCVQVIGQGRDRESMLRLATILRIAMKSSLDGMNQHTGGKAFPWIKANLAELERTLDTTLIEKYPLAHVAIVDSPLSKNNVAHTIYVVTERKFSFPNKINLARQKVFDIDAFEHRVRENFSALFELVSTRNSGWIYVGSAVNNVNRTLTHNQALLNVEDRLKRKYRKMIDTLEKHGTCKFEKHILVFNVHEEQIAEIEGLMISMFPWEVKTNARGEGAAFVKRYRKRRHAEMMALFQAEMSSESSSEQDEFSVSSDSDSDGNESPVRRRPMRVLARGLLTHFNTLDDDADSELSAEEHESALSSEPEVDESEEDDAENIDPTLEADHLSRKKQRIRYRHPD